MKWGWIAAGVGGLAALWAFAAAAKPGATIARNRAREMFEIEGPDCRTIRFRGLADDADENAVRRAYEKLDTFYIDPMIVELRAKGVQSAPDFASGILDDLFPECAPWETQALTGLDKAVIWGAMLLHVQERLEQSR